MKSSALIVSLLTLGEGLGKRVCERNPFLLFVVGEWHSKTKTMSWVKQR